VARLALAQLGVFGEVAGEVQRIDIPSSSMLDSLLLDMSRRSEHELLADGDPAAELIESSAWAIGRKYRVDEAHAAKVRELALQLFDGVRRFTTLADRSRVLLAVAAILHDVGVFVASADHELHSGYLIRASQILGLSASEVERVALIARFHRKDPPPRESHVLSQFPPAVRVELLKLSALLRVADSLDADHAQRVERVRVEMTAEALEVRAETRTGDRESFAAIRRAFGWKANLCEELFGVEARLSEVLAT
jgi:exopolyphosphatase/guanosine-5'-triphosphate,3'-diphosphate pyrophosphatase